MKHVETIGQDRSETICALRQIDATQRSVFSLFRSHHEKADAVSFSRGGSGALDKLLAVKANPRPIRDLSSRAFANNTAELRWSVPASNGGTTKIVSLCNVVLNLEDKSYGELSFWASFRSNTFYNAGQIRAYWAPLPHLAQFAVSHYQCPGRQTQWTKQRYPSNNRRLPCTTLRAPAQSDQLMRPGASACHPTKLLSTRVRWEDPEANTLP